MATEEFITVGQLGRPRGTAGEIYVTPLTDFPERFENIEEIYVSSGDSWSKMKVVSSKMVANRPVLQFENITNPEGASRLTNRYLAVPKSQVMKLPQNSFYIFDLVGCQVFDEATDKKIGAITDVEEFPASDVYTIKSGDGKTFSLAAVKIYVKEIDIENRRIVIDSSGLVEA